MSDLLQSKKSLTRTDLDPEDLQAIFNNIDDSLAFWQVLYNESVNTPGDGAPISLKQINELAYWLRMSSAPLYPSLDATGVRGFIYRLLNLAVKVFAAPQIHFNRKLRDLIGELLVAFQEFNSQTTAMEKTIESLNARVRSLEDENRLLHRNIEALSGQEEALGPDRSPHDPGKENHT